MPSWETASASIPLTSPDFIVSACKDSTCSPSHARPAPGHTAMVCHIEGGCSHCLLLGPWRLRKRVERRGHQRSACTALLDITRGHMLCLPHRTALRTCTQRNWSYQTLSAGRSTRSRHRLAKLAWLWSESQVQMPWKCGRKW